MTEAVVNGKDTRCLFINNGDDLLTLKKVVSKKTDNVDCEKQKNKKTKETNGNELNGNHNKTDSINFDVDNTSSLEPNLEMDSDTDRNITIGSVCTQEDQESENIDISNENSNEADTKIGDKESQESPMKSSDDIPYSPNVSLDSNDYSHDLDDDDEFDFDNVKSPASYFNISSRAPLHSNIELDITLEEDDILVEKGASSSNERKRKFEDSPEREQLPNKVTKFWNIIKFPFHKITTGVLANSNQLNTSEAEIVSKEESTEMPNNEIVSDNQESDVESGIESENNSIEKSENKDQSPTVLNSTTELQYQRSCCIM
ncbi:uncharacterized protein LOC126838561 [Adelges cooleyi]|uniref:uncharacterized protein LOC126838561 n=1 Tax=Adelges cooleyi TaxID=133065 RepID=UPI00217FB5E4|nr:uncharacterized protein LOC126838561 [Adelges cooleyi]